MDGAQAAQGGGVVWRERQKMVVHLDRVVAAIGGVEGFRQAQQPCRFVGPQPQRPAIGSSSFDRQLLRLQCLGQGFDKLKRVWRQIYSAGEEFDGGLRLIGLLIKDADQVKRVSVVGVRVERLLIELPRFGEMAGPVVLNALAEKVMQVGRHRDGWQWK